MLSVPFWWKNFALYITGFFHFNNLKLLLRIEEDVDGKFRNLLAK
jgi:hypothetical protein